MKKGYYAFHEKLWFCKKTILFKNCSDRRIVTKPNSYEISILKAEIIQIKRTTKPPHKVAAKRK